jgi:hypothetical protein
MSAVRLCCTKKKAELGLHFRLFRPQIYCSAGADERMAGSELHEWGATEREDGKK